LRVKGYDAGKRINGKKRHILVDTRGLLLHAMIHPALKANHLENDAAKLTREHRRADPH